MSASFGDRNPCNSDGSTGRPAEDAGQPGTHRRGNRLGIRLEAMVTGNPHDVAVGAGRRHPETIALALDDEGRHLHCVELG